MSVSEMITVPEQSRDIVDAMGRSGACAPILGLSVRRFAAMTGAQYETAQHWIGTGTRRRCRVGCR